VTLRERIKDLLRVAGVDIEGHLLNYQPRQSGGFLIKQKGKQPIVNIVIADPAASKALIENAPPESIVNEDREDLAALTRDDIARYDLLAIAASLEDKDLLRMMSKIADTRDLEALSIAMTIRKFEIAGNAELFGRLRRKLRLEYGERGNRIYVFFSSGLFREFLFPVLIWVRVTPTPTDVDRAKQVFEKCIEHMEHAIYVNTQMSIERIVGQLRYRFTVDRVNVVLVFGRTRPIIDKIRKAIKQFVSGEEERQIDRRSYRVREELFRVGNVDSITVIIARQEA